MKKIFGVLSLIAIVTVAFTSQASTDVGTDNFEFVVSMESPSTYVAVATVEVPIIGVFNVTDLSVKDFTIGEGVDIPNIASKDFFINLGNDFATAHLPFEVGLLSEASYNKSISPNLNEYIKDYNKHYGSTSLIKDIATNVGKLTKLTITF